LVEQVGLGDGVEAGETDVTANQRAIFLFDQGIVVLVKGARAGQREVGDGLVPVPEQEAIEELEAVVGVEFQDGERQAGQETLERVLHDQETAAQDGDPFAPAGGHIDQLERVGVLASGGGATMVDQVDFEMAGIGQVPGQAAGGDRAGQEVGC